VLSFWLVTAMAASVTTELTAPAGSLDEPPRVEKRDLPNYDGRDAPKQGADGLRWIPRILFSPLWGMIQTGIQPEVRHIVRWSDRIKLRDRIRYIDRNGQARLGIMPTFLVDLVTQPSVGLIAWGHEVPERLRFNFHGAFGGINWWIVSARVNVRIGPSHPSWGRGRDASTIQTWVLASERQDWVYAGSGDIQGDSTRYGWRQLRIFLSGKFQFDRNSGFEVGSEWASHRFQVPARGYYGDPPIDQVWDPATIPGFEGYDMAAPYIRFRWDTRRPRPASDTGFLVRVRATGGIVYTDIDASFLRTYVEATGSWDVTGSHRTFEFDAMGAYSVAPGSGDVPFTEQIQLGGTRWLQAFSVGHIRGHTAMGGAIRYNWPVWAIVEGSVSVEVAQTFGPRFDGIGEYGPAWSIAGGVKTARGVNPGFRLMFAMGFTPFEPGANLRINLMSTGF